MNMTTPPQLANLAVSPMTPVDAPAQPASSRRRKLAIVCAALLVAAGGAWYEFGTEKPVRVIARADAATANGRQSDGSFRLTPAEARMLRVEPVSTRDFRPERVAEGRISYNEERSTPVFAPYTGRVVRAVAQPGQQVKAGDVLFEIETADLTQAANDLLAALDNVTKTRNQIELTRRNDARQRDLFAARAASRRDMEQAQADLANATADQRTAEATLSAARDRLRLLGRSTAAIAQIEQTRRVDSVVAVTAPLAGTVVQRRIGPGQWVNSGASDPVFTIADLSEMWLVANVRELDVPLVQQGQQVQVTVDALPGREFPARIQNVGAALDPATRRLTVRAAVQDPDHVLKPEMFASFRISVGDSTSAISVPAGALIHRGSNVALWEALDDNRFIMRTVQTGLRAGDQVQLTQGVSPNSRIVTGGALFIDRAATQD